MKALSPRYPLWLAFVAVVLFTPVVPAQQATMAPAEMQRRRDLEAKLQDIAVVERRVMIPMKDGVRLATDIYRPKRAAGKVPIMNSKMAVNPPNSASAVRVPLLRCGSCGSFVSIQSSSAIATKSPGACATDWPK